MYFFSEVVIFFWVLVFDGVCCFLFYLELGLGGFLRLEVDFIEEFRRLGFRGFRGGVVGTV